MRSKKPQNVLARLKLITGTTTDVSLALALQISPQTLSSWKGRGSTPYSKCVEIAQSRGVSLDWLLLGVGPILRAAAVPTAESNSDIPAEENTLLALWRRLDEREQTALQTALEEKQRLREMERRLCEMTSILSRLKQQIDI